MSSIKIVVNNDYGSFGEISKPAVLRAQELGWTISEGYSEDRTGNLDPTAQILHYGVTKHRSDGIYKIEEENVSRTDPILIQLVEELGELMNGSYASYAIVEIPDDVAWEIKEYDGFEWVAERHRTWYAPREE